MSDSKTLSHDLSSPELVALNEQIEATLDEVNTDTEKLNELMASRHQVLTQLLNELPSQQKKAFAKAETPINEYLSTYIGAMFKESSDTLFNLRKGRKAIKHYKQA